MLCPQDQLVAHVHFRDNVLDLLGLLENKAPPRHLQVGPDFLHYQFAPYIPFSEKHSFCFCTG